MRRTILKAGFRERQVAVGLLVLGLHLLVIMAWWSQQYHLPTLPIRNTANPISIWLEALPQALLTPTKTPLAHSTVAPNGATPRTDPSRPATLETPSSSPDALKSPPQPNAPVGAVAPPTAAEPALNLSLSRKDAATLVAPGYAAQSPFHGRLPATVERAIANVAAQTGPWTEERVDYDHIRFRRGNTCIMLERPQIATLDPFSDAAARTPWKASLTDC